MKDMLMKDYKVSDLIVKNGETYKVTHNGEFCLREEDIWILEDQLSDEDKLEIFDFHTKGLGSYLLGIIKQYQLVRNDREILKRNSSGDFNKISLRKWLKSVDPRKEISTYHSYPTYWMFGREYRLTEECPTTDYGYKMTYSGQPVIRQWFHELLRNLLKEETEWFVNNDAHEIKLASLVSLVSKVGTLDNEKLIGLLWNNQYEGFTDEELDRYIEVLTDISNYMDSKKELLKGEVKVCQE